MSKVIPGDSLTAYERWELPSMDVPNADMPSMDMPDMDIPGMVKPVREPSLEPDESTSPPSAKPQSQAAVGSMLSPPTLEEIETIQQQAQEEGFGTGYQEGRKEGLEQGHKKGYQEGHAKGCQQGLEQGIAAGRDEIISQVQKLGQILDFMSRPLNDLDAEVEQELVHLATAIARQLIRRELKTSPGEIVAVVREAVGLLPVANREVTVHLHPEDARIVQEALVLGNQERSWRIQDDPTLTRGGCRVESDASRIDASVEERLGGVIATVLGDERQQERG